MRSLFLTQALAMLATSQVETPVRQVRRRKRRVKLSQPQQIRLGRKQYAIKGIRP